MQSQIVTNRYIYIAQRIVSSFAIARSAVALRRKCNLENKSWLAAADTQLKQITFNDKESYLRYVC